MVEVRPLALAGLLEILPARFGDDRGFFSEVWSAEKMAAAGVDMDFVQDNHSYSAERGVLRGLHFQVPPAGQAKLVRVSRGAIFDVAVDIRQDSPTYGKWAGLIVSAEKWNQILVPVGFAHGFVTLEDNSEVQYKVSAPYRADLDRAIRFDDPAIAIEWPLVASAMKLSAKDAEAPMLADVDTGF